MLCVRNFVIIDLIIETVKSFQHRLMADKLNQYHFVRMRSENMPKTRVSFCQIVTILAPL